MTHSDLTNVLGDAASPYLQQHKDNPVHWQVWSDSALMEARRTGKPILLSVGYAACHWCHVMAHESFEDPATAEVMNELFVNIKVDREERTDIDQIYMAALHAMGEQGGWPLTMFLNSDAEPFWGGTYFPKTSAYGRPDFVTVLRSIADIYRKEPDKVARNATAVRAHLDQTLASDKVPEDPVPETLGQQARGILSIIDRQNGGIGQAPKFPNASMLETLWRSWRTDASPLARDAAISWIRSMINGGIYDHLGGGMARYTVDAAWLVPHFEKMLYDNAQLLRSLVWAYAETGDELFRVRIEETIDWLKREMLLPEGGFASSLDADSEGEEGKFYVWDKGDIDRLLGEQSEVFCTNYDVSRDGNWEGKTILNRLANPPTDDTQMEETLAACRRILLAERGSRVRPGRDDKVLADWNGLLIRALAEAGQALDRPDWVDQAKTAFDFVSESMCRERRLAHAWRNGIATYPALSSDYGAMINAALSLYAVDADEKYLIAARSYADVLDRHYLDGAGGTYFTADDANDVLLRTRHEHDEAAPSAGSQVLEALARLALIDDNADLTLRTRTMAAAMWGRVKEMPMAASGAVNAIATVANPRKLVLLNPANDMIQAMRESVDPGRFDLIVRDADTADTIVPGDTVSAYVESGKQKGAAAFLCNGPVCLAPITDAEELKLALRPGSS